MNAATKYAAWKRAHGVDGSQPFGSRATIEQELGWTRRAIERAESGRKHAPSGLDLERIDAKIARLEQAELALTERLNEMAPYTPGRCRRCDEPTASSVLYTNSGKCDTCSPTLNTDRRAT
jgi:hypothetical protein